ncbi:gene transfer agent family protein [Pseudotabrizicola algicola]|uniref:Gene transfer agent family protein n=1 Tax=Pseudotabrizicola algicola TaxID=2709381 RepID=A0A6B3RLP6_9RHOB|nr:gene transfer agent family protein [Pseudotabrizicola algicola]NEX45185.1 gene transfer agent family protein [Pseudotabrizicola algicola]
MTRRDEGEASFECDGEIWRLRFDFNAMCDFQEATGKPIFATLEAMEAGGADPADIRALFWAMLRDAHPDITLRQAGRMVTQGMGALQKAAMSALPSAQPDEGGEQPEKPKAAPSRAA